MFYVERTKTEKRLAGVLAQEARAESSAEDIQLAEGRRQAEDTGVRRVQGRDDTQFHRRLEEDQHDRGARDSRTRYRSRGAADEGRRGTSLRVHDLWTDGHG